MDVTEYLELLGADSEEFVEPATGTVAMHVLQGPTPSLSGLGSTPALLLGGRGPLVTS